ncbi:MAG: hypothetical protein K9N55_04535 [Phycisphaerae bacterium]|nr:hypothetical protein [Phycisphaerae bacterium]
MQRQKLNLLLLDADVIIFAHELGIWEQLIDACQISVTEIIISEATMWFDENDEQHAIDLSPLITAGKIQAVSVSLSQVINFRKRFNLVYLDGMHDGETEPLALLDSSDEKWKFCSGDAISFKVLGCLDKGNQGISLEEILHDCGLSVPSNQNLANHTKAYRQKCTRQGELDRLLGMAFHQD